MNILTPSDFTLLDDTATYIRRFVVLSDEAVTACVLWVAHTHVIRAAQVTPYLHPMSPDKESGKTTLYDVLGRVCARPWQTAHATAAAIRRGLDTDPPPTLMIDEVETIFQKQGDDFMRGVLDAGFRRGATVSILERPSWVMRQFKVFGPKLLAGIGVLPDTVEGRCIPIVMRPKLPTDQVERARERTLTAASAPIISRFETWTAECTDYLCEVEPPLPDFLSSRQMDFWEPLLAIADLFQQGWPEQARAAAHLLHERHIEDSEGIELLRDIRDLFITEESEAMYSEEIVNKLLANEELRWKHIEFRGRLVELDVWHLARFLREYSVRPYRMRLYIENDKQARGYHRDQFTDAWDRRLGPPSL